MTAVNSVAGSSSGLAPATTLPGPQLNQNDFLKLMIEQFRAQDPTQPQDPSQMVGEMAQFSQIAATQQMQVSLSQLATSLQGNQLLGASNLLGRQVLVPSSQVTIAGSGSAGVSGAVNVPGATDNLQVSISDASGKTVRTLDLGAQPAGFTQFQWDGLDASGKPVPAGTYTLSAANANVAFSTYASGQVQAVNGTGGTINLQVGGVGSVPLSQVAQIL